MPLGKRTYELGQLIPLKQLQRYAGSLVDTLRAPGAVEELVITARGKPVAVLITVERYEELTNA